MTSLIFGTLGRFCLNVFVEFTMKLLMEFNLEHKIMFKDDILFVSHVENSTLA